jgi:hypothetical protein
MIMDDWLRFRSFVSFRNFLEGAVLSIERRDLARGDSFQCLFHLLWSLFAKSWRTAEMLCGIRFLRKGGRSPGSLESPCAAFLASSSARSLGAKSWCPGTQIRRRSITPFLRPFQTSPSLTACSHSCLLCSPSCFACNFSAASWISSRI